MLAHLHVKNLALIEEIEVEFGPGLNILTGETGAGKSILLGSMQLILGAKTSKNMIRENASYALVELLFQVENEKALETLKALDICPEDGQVLLSRKITDIGAMVKLVKAAKDIPCAVGFGISTPEQAKKMAAQSDGAIVGSAIVKLCAEHGADCVPYVKEYVKAMKDAVMEA